MQKLRILAAALLAVPMIVALTGCDGGDTNPVTPEKMEEIRNKTNAERENFKPPTNVPKPGN